VSKTEQRIVGWGGLVIAIIGVAIARGVWLTQPVGIPAWILAATFWLVVVGAGMLVWSLTRTRQALARLDEIDTTGDLPFRKSDPKMTPLCPKCLTDPTPTYRPVHLTTLNGTPWFTCDNCETSRAIQHVSISRASGVIPKPRGV